MVGRTAVWRNNLLGLISPADKSESCALCTLSGPVTSKSIVVGWCVWSFISTAQSCLSHSSCASIKGVCPSEATVAALQPSANSSLTSAKSPTQTARCSTVHPLYIVLTLPSLASCQPLFPIITWAASGFLPKTNVCTWLSYVQLTHSSRC